VSTTYNAALNRPVFASSVLRNWGYADNGETFDFIPSLANDGNLETNLFGNGSTASCFHSKKEDYPWWAVDLGRPMVVYGAVFTSGGGGTGMMKYKPVLKL